MSIRSVMKKFSVLLPALLVLFLACGDKPTNPSSFDIDDFPAAPTNVKASVGDGVVVLTWSHPSLEDVKSFEIYRQDSTASELKNIGSTDRLTYVDRDLQNNREFRYRISALGKNGLRGRQSALTSAVPAVFGVTINSGNEYTTSRTVILSFTAPANTALVKIGNDSLSLDNAQWERFVVNRNWDLSFEDGKKTVIVKFRDVGHRETSEPKSDSIVLDSKAIINQVTEDSDGRVLTENDSIHFAIATGEPKGQAWIDLAKVQAEITLFDDGTNGDSVPDDGIYEVDYQIPGGSQAENAGITGHFVDRAGNVASNLHAPGRVTIRRPPVAVTLLSVSSITSSPTSLSLFWTKNSDDDFASYRIFRTEVPGVDTKSPLVTIIQNPSILTYTDTTLTANTAYYYRVYVFDNSGLFSASNEESDSTISSQPPVPVNLIQVAPVASSFTSLDIFWTSSSDKDFRNYAIFRSTTPGVDSNSILVTILADRSAVSFTDTGLETNKTYYYRVYVFDTKGLFSASNEVEGTTNEDLPPIPVNLVQVASVDSSFTSLDIFWTASSAEDFMNYSIFRSTTPDVDTNSTLVSILADQSTVSFTDTGLESNTTYFYRVYVFDANGHSAPSNLESGTTIGNLPPIPVNLVQVASVNSSSTSLDIYWTVNSERDFQNYAIFRSTVPGVDTESSLVTILADQSVISFTDTALEPNTTYFYRVYVFDEYGLFSGSNELSGTSNPNHPPQPVNLSLPVQTDSLVFHLSWSQSNDVDFASYRIYRSEFSPVDTTSALVIFNNDPSITQYDDTSVAVGILYFYRVFVFDMFGLSAGSNEVSGTVSN